MRPGELSAEVVVAVWATQCKCNPMTTEDGTWSAEMALATGTKTVMLRRQQDPAPSGVRTRRIRRTRSKGEQEPQRRRRPRAMSLVVYSMKRGKRPGRRRRTEPKRERRVMVEGSFTWPARSGS